MPIPRPLHLFVGSATVAAGIAFSIAISVATDKGAWTTKTPAPTKRTEVVAAALGGKIYVIGGFDRSMVNIWNPTASVYEYDSQSNQWRTRAPMPTPRGALAVAVLDGKLHAVGGYTRDSNTGAHEVYDPQTDSWSSAAPLLVPRDHHAAAVAGGRLYAIGGRLNRQYSQNLAVNEMYDPSNNQWTRKADMPTARSGITAGVLGGRIYVFGGEATSGTFHESP